MSQPVQLRHADIHLMASAVSFAADVSEILAFLLMLVMLWLAVRADRRQKYRPRHTRPATRHRAIRHFGPPERRPLARLRPGIGGFNNRRAAVREERLRMRMEQAAVVAAPYRPQHAKVRPLTALVAGQPAVDEGSDNHG